MPATLRDRVTVDLRGAGPAVQHHAAAQGLTVAAFVRRAVLSVAVSPSTSLPADTAGDGADDGPPIKVTLRLPAAHAQLLALRSRRAEISQGSYVAGLLDGLPPPPATDRREIIASLARSTDQLAILCTDLQAFLRLLGRVPVERLEPYRASVMSLSKRAHEHLDLASRVVADLQPTSKVRLRRSSSGGKRR